MKVIILEPKEDFEVPIEAEVIKPDEFAGLSIDEIEALKVHEGNTERELGELFDVEGETADDPEDIEIRIAGDVPNVKYIGHAMTAGRIVIEGDTGMHTGAEMEGGEIIVQGNADSWVGREMKGGKLIVEGDAGDYVGSTYRGEWRGTKGGTIIVKGDAGNEIGEWMADGEIIIEGSVSRMAGIHMQGGRIIVKGDADLWAGAEMEGGEIIIMGRAEDVLPGFKYEGVTEVDGVPGTYHMFVGDHACGLDVEGKLYLNSALNPRP